MFLTAGVARVAPAVSKKAMTMKKTYIEPTVDVFQLNTNVSLLTGSVTETLGDAIDTSTGELDGREYDFGDDFTFEEDNDFSF